MHLYSSAFLEKSKFSSWWIFVIFIFHVRIVWPKYCLPKNNYLRMSHFFRIRYFKCIVFWLENKSNTKAGLGTAFSWFFFGVEKREGRARSYPSGILDPSRLTQLIQIRMRKVTTWRLKKGLRLAVRKQQNNESSREREERSLCLNTWFKGKANSQRNNELRITGKVQMNQCEERR